VGILAILSPINYIGRANSLLLFREDSEMFRKSIVQVGITWSGWATDLEKDERSHLMQHTISDIFIRIIVKLLNGCLVIVAR